MPSFNPKVSIIIPVYNGSNYLREAIDSALAQTYNNIEIIVVNDGSTDDGKTEAIVKSYGSKIKYLSKNNGGVSSALNLGINNMSGDYFAWLSHDDLFSANRVTEDMQLFRKHVDVKITFCELSYIDSDGNIIRELKHKLAEVNCPWDMMHLNFLNMCTITIHKSCFDRVGLFNDSNRTMQDVEILLLLSQSYKFINNPSSKTYSRVHPEQGTTTLKSIHNKESLELANMINKTFKFKDIFPFADCENKLEISNYWSYLGNFYSTLGDYSHANQCYCNGYRIYKNIFSKSGLRRIVGAKLLNSKFICFLTTLMNRLVDK